MATDRRIVQGWWVVLLALVVTPLWGTEYFVAPGGSDSNDGTSGWGQAFATISNAVAQASASDVVTVSNGTYNISAEIIVNKAVTVRSFGGGVYGGLANATNTVIDGPANLGNSGPRIFSVTDAGAVLDGLTITDGDGRLQSPGGLGVYMTDGLLVNCIIKENGDMDTNTDHADGGGVYMTGGTVSNCTVQANKVRYGSTTGAGIYATGGQILYSRILDNETWGSGGGGGIFATSASVLIRSCLITGNSATAAAGGGVRGGTVESCTIVGNTDSSTGDGVYGCTVKNSIVLDNGDSNYSGGSFTFSSSSPTPSGDGNVASASFVDAAGGNYQLLACPAVDAGTNDTWMTGATDLAGNPRLSGSGSVVDMGAYEKQPGALECSFSADETSVVAPADVVFTALLSGTNLNITSYAWDFGDGNTETGAGLAVVTNTYTAAGGYTVTLTVTNDAFEVASVTNTDYIAVWGDTAYVSASSPSPAVPYATWASAAHTIVAVVDTAPVGVTVVITNGTYNLTQPMVLDKAITLIGFGDGVSGGLANATNTVVDQGGSNMRVIKITDAGVVLDGLTISGGNGRGDSYQTDGSGVNMTDGTVQNCIIKDNGGVPDYSIRVDGVGVWMSGGTVSNCIVSGNVGLLQSLGGGIYATGGQVLDCQVVDNSIVDSSGDGGGIYASGVSVLIRNTLVARNATSDQGGGVYLANGSIESCTVVSNSAASGAGGVYRTGGTVNNSIVYHNTVGGSPDDLNTTAGLTYSCASDGNTSSGNITDAPTFVDLAGGDYRLEACPAVNAGLNQAWMVGATDLAGTNRILVGDVDMGAYERPPSTTLECLFVADVTSVVAPSDVVFTATVSGGNTNITDYVWDFGDGQTTNSSTRAVVTNTYSAAGLYTVTLTVTNNAAASASSTNTDYIAVWGDYAYVSASSPSPAEPYHTWANAAHTIADAISGAPVGATVAISNGTYNISEQIVVDKAITVTSFGDGIYGGLANASNTVIDAIYGGSVSSGPRVFHITDASAVLDGLTITGGTGRGDGTPGDPGNEDGNGIFMTGGLVQNCIIKENGLATGYDHCQGGGIYMAGGTVTNCTIQGNWTGAGTVHGGGIHATGGQILNSRILDNSIRATGSGGGIYATSGSVLIRNCLVADNTAQGNGGGIYGGTVESCTIVTNTAGADGSGTGGGVYGSTVENSIVLNNDAGSGFDHDYASSTFSHSCSTPTPSGDGNIDTASFVDAAAGNYQLTACPAVNFGTNQAWMVGATDLAGTNRILSGNVDMGAYERPPSSVLECLFLADVTSVVAPSNVVFTATVTGGNTNITDYAWDFGDGQTTNSSTRAVVTNTYNTAGLYTVTLTVTNDAAGVAVATNSDYIAVWGTYAYVAPSSPSPAEPYHTWANAAHSIADAVNGAPAGATVVVSNGTYNITQQVEVDEAITVVSYGAGVYGGLANASNTVVQRSSGTLRIFEVTDGGAVLDGLTLRNGIGRGDGGWNGNGVYMANGCTVKNCIIKDNGTSGDASHLYGGGVHMTSGLLSNCVVQANNTGGGNSPGGGIYASGGLITHCRVLNNTTLGGYGGGGIYASSSSVLIRNCLITGNTTIVRGGGVHGGTVESSTIVDNTVTGTNPGSNTGGGVYGGGVTNSIVLDNQTGSADASIANYDSSSTFAYSCATPEPSGVGNTDTALFVDAGAGNYQLEASPAVNGGTNLAWMVGAYDLAGTNRILAGTVDMGAYERVPSTTLECSFLADVTSVLTGSDVEFTATVGGGNTNITDYVWDFGDGQTASGASLGVITNTYNAVGLYTVTLMVTNDAAQGASATNADYIAVWGSQVYVSGSSPSPAEPYHTWANAAHSLSDAVSGAPAGATIVVSNGTYNITDEIVVDKAITVISYGNGVYGGLDNAALTIVDGPQNAGYSGPRIFSVTHADAVLDGLTITDGYGRLQIPAGGLGVYMTDGLLRNCIIKENGALDGNTDHADGGGVYMTGGVVSNCTIQANQIGYGNTTGAGIYATGGMITHCRLLDNETRGSGGGGGIYASGASVVIRNCLVARNTATAASGGGLYLNSGSVESCTIVTNSAASGAGGVYRNSGTVNNSIVYFNTVGGVLDDLNTTVGLTYTCASDGNTTDDNITGDPLFVNVAGGDYRLVRESPCRDAGDNSVITWGTDLDEGTRIRDGVVDMGAFEWTVYPTVFLFR
jgi:PKD repeat protein